MFTFSKEERLSSKKVIDRLFAEGKSMHVTPFRIIWLEDTFESNQPSRVMIGIPRKKIRIAVKRNLLKRRIREAYRLNKKPFVDFLTQHGRCCSVAFIYTSDNVTEYKELEEKIILVLKRLQKEYEKDNQ